MRCNVFTGQRRGSWNSPRLALGFDTDVPLARNASSNSLTRIAKRLLLESQQRVFLSTASQHDYAFAGEVASNEFAIIRFNTAVV